MNAQECLLINERIAKSSPMDFPIVKAMLQYLIAKTGSCMKHEVVQKIREDFMRKMPEQLIPIPRNSDHHLHICNLPKDIICNSFQYLRISELSSPSLTSRFMFYVSRQPGSVVHVTVPTCFSNLPCYRSFTFNPRIVQSLKFNCGSSQHQTIIGKDKIINFVQKCANLKRLEILLPWCSSKVNWGFPEGVDILPNVKTLVFSAGSKRHHKQGKYDVKLLYHVLRHATHVKNIYFPNTAEFDDLLHEFLASYSSLTTNIYIYHWDRDLNPANFVRWGRDLNPDNYFRWDRVFKPNKQLFRNIGLLELPGDDAVAMFPALSKYLAEGHELHFQHLKLDMLCEETTYKTASNMLFHLLKHGCTIELDRIDDFEQAADYLRHLRRLLSCANDSTENLLLMRNLTLNFECFLHPHCPQTHCKEKFPIG